MRRAAAGRSERSEDGTPPKAPGPRYPLNIGTVWPLAGRAGVAPCLPGAGYPGGMPDLTPEAHLAAILAALGYDADPECAGTPARVLEVLRAHAPGRPLPALPQVRAAPGVWQAAATVPSLDRGWGFR